MPATPKQRKIAIMGYRLDDIKDLNFRIGIKNKVQVCPLGWFKNPVSSQTDKLMAGTNFSDYLGLKHYKEK